MTRLLAIYDMAKKQVYIVKYELSQMSISEDILSSLYDRSSLVEQKTYLDRSVQQAMASRDDSALTLSTTTRSIYDMNEEILQLSSNRTDYMDLEK